jgi:hypothetical protein
MGKRSSFERLPQDSYATPFAAAAVLFPHLPPRSRYVEPCAGQGKLIQHLESVGHELVSAHDLPTDARSHRYDVPADVIAITNPPWKRAILHEIIVNLSNQFPSVWLLLDFNWLATKQAGPYLPRLRRIAIIGRVKWIEDSKFTGKDDSCWCLFSKPSEEPATFIGRQSSSQPVARASRSGITVPPEPTDAPPNLPKIEPLRDAYRGILVDLNARIRGRTG